MKKFLTASPKRFIFISFLLFQFSVLFNFCIASKYIDPQKNFFYAGKGYHLHQKAFSPLYPGLIRALGKLLAGRYSLAGFLISSFFLLGALFIFYELVKLDWKKEIAQKSIIYLLVFPTSFFFVAIYPESLFLFLVLLSFYWARKKKWWLAPLAAALASATQLAGVFLLPALLFEAWRQQKKGESLKIGFLFLVVWLVLVSSSGFFLSRSPAFFHGGKITLFYRVFWRYLKMIVTCEKGTALYFKIWLEFLSALLFLGLLVFNYLKKINPSYLIFAFLAYTAPTLSGTFLSMPRHVLVLFPGFIALSLLEEKYRFLGKVYLVISIILLFVSQLFFNQGYWVG